MAKKRASKKRNLLNYKKQLEQRTQEMILVHDPNKLIKEIMETLVAKIRLKHTAALIYSKEKETYILTVSGGEKGLKIPEGYARLDPNNALIHLFTSRKNYLFDKNGVISYIRIKQVLKNKSLSNQEKGLREIILAAKRQMELYRISVCLPIYVWHRELLGTLMLGDKRSNEKFSKAELNFFVALTGNIAMAIRNAQLHEFEVKAEKLAGMTNLLDGLNHEFRNQINTVQFYISNIDNAELSQKDIKNYRPFALKAFENMLMILQSVFDYRSSCEKKEITSINIRKAIDTAIGELRDKITSIKAKVTMDVSKELPEIETYPSFNYLFLNLFRNSYYAIAQKKIRCLDIKAYQSKDTQNSLEVVITDTGGDMLKAMEEARAAGGENFPERSNIGGINFFLAKHIIEDHHGELIITTCPIEGSPEDKGTIFRIKLPIKQPKSARL